MVPPLFGPPGRSLYASVSPARVTNGPLPRHGARERIALVTVAVPAAPTGRFLGPLRPVEDSRRSGCDSETHSAAPLRSALTVSDSLGGARRVLALFCVVGYEVDGIIGKWLWRCQLLPGG